VSPVALHAARCFGDQSPVKRRKVSMLSMLVRRNHVLIL
jgi:hypothetical protein